MKDATASNYDEAHGPISFRLISSCTNAEASDTKRGTSIPVPDRLHHLTTPGAHWLGGTSIEKIPGTTRKNKNQDEKWT